jgi:DNA-binding transcriptional MerR regulator
MTEPVGVAIGFVSRVTGLSAHRIRAWERRYRAVAPSRTAGGRRIYSRADINRLQFLRQAVDLGHRISHIAALETSELADLANRGLLPGAPAIAAVAAARRPEAALVGGPGDHVAAGLEAVSALDCAALKTILHNAGNTFSRRQVLEEVLQPLMAAVGRGWAQGSLRIVHEHMATGVALTFLAGMLDRRPYGAMALPRILVAAPSGQCCFLGALAVAVTAQDLGWDPVFLGPNLPVEEITAAKSRLSPRMIALSITSRVDDRSFQNALEGLSGVLDGQCPLVIGGRAGHLYREGIEAIGGRVCSTTGELVSLLIDRPPTGFSAG